jgi:hypothetical protein
MKFTGNVRPACDRVGQGYERAAGRAPSFTSDRR